MRHRLTEMEIRVRKVCEKLNRHIQSKEECPKLKTQSKEMIEKLQASKKD